MTATKTHRTFIGIPVPADAQNFLDQWLTRRQKLLQNTGIENPEERVIPHHNRHITLHFLGDITGKQRQTLSENLNTELKNLRHFTLNFHQLQHFPDAKSPILAATCEVSTPLLNVWQHTASALRQSGLEERLSTREFRPHITLIRGKLSPTIEEKRALTELPIPKLEIRVSEVRLYNSTVDHTGSNYQAIHTSYLD